MLTRILLFLAIGCFLFAFTTITAQAQNAAEGKKLYASYCSTCHGEQGKGDGMAARALPVKPADHTSGAIMNQLSDQFLFDIISKGGSAVGSQALCHPGEARLTKSRSAT
jgi:hypothetical protein